MRKGYLILFAFMLGASAIQAQVTFTSSNLPIIVINTNGLVIKDEPKITADMKVIYNAGGARNNLTDPANDYDGKIGIEIRGSTSQDLFPKKQYGIELRTAAGASVDAPLLGLPKKDDWVLFATYNDKSLIREVLAYKLGRDLGRYASRYRYCEVVINNEYQGIYILLEKIKRDKNRVNIDKLDPTEITGDNLTGGYIIKIDKMEGNGGEGWTSAFTPSGRKGNQTIFFQYEYPKQEDIVPEQKQYIRNYMNAFETVLSGIGFKDPAEGYAKYIDVNSFVDYFIANEVTRNPDAYRLSTFMHKKKDSEGGKLAMGPVWDFNLGFGNVDFCAKGKPEGFIIDYNSICPDDFWLIPFWWQRLFQDDAFRTQVTSRWVSLRNGPYQTSKIMSFIDSAANVLNMESQQRNFQKWDILGKYVWPNSYVGPTFQDEVVFLKDWTTKRLQWLDANIPGLTTAVENPNPVKFSITAYPNPFVDQIQLGYTLDNPGTLLIEVFSSSGEKIESSEHIHQMVGNFDLVITPKKLSSGFYLIKATLGKEHRLLKVIRR